MDLPTSSKPIGVNEYLEENIILMDQFKLLKQG